MSSLVDLKAELKKKEAEVTNSKVSLDNGSKNKTFRKLREMTSQKKKKRKKLEDWKETNDEPSDELEEIYVKSQQKLIAKSKIYDKMLTGEMEDVEDFQGETRYLVDFVQKEIPESSRTVTSENVFEANEDYREELHEKWRKEQEEILNGPVHYENIKFDEIRDLGTGYFAFSKNEEERQRQMEELKSIRKETISIQMKKDALKNKRKAALDARLKKVKQRKATEEGRLDDFLRNEKEQDESTHNTDESTHKTDENKYKTDETSLDTDEILRDLRKSSSTKPREWDMGKTGNFIPQTFVKEKKSSYEQRIEELRKERLNDFAPPSFY